MPPRTLTSVMLAITAILAVGCRDMYEQPKGDPLESSSLFDDGMLARPLVEGVVPRGALRDNTPYYTGRDQNQLLAHAPVAITHDLLVRGQERYNIFCSPCHNQNGDGRGMIVLRGFKEPPSLHDERMRAVPDGHIFDVITNGFGTMYPYAQRVPVDDRWAIVAYIRALQLSQHATLDDVPPQAREELMRRPQPSVPPSDGTLRSQFPSVEEMRYE